MVKIGGLQKVTLIDYPGLVATSVFLAICNFRCPYCHNPDLIETASDKKYIPEKEFFSYLKKRKGLLEGVCVGGGEPLMSKDLVSFLEKIKKLGYLIKLDTNGSKPDLLEKLIKQGLIDYIAMDVKASLEQYDKVTNVKINNNKIKQSIKLIMDSGLDYEFRTTVLPKFHDLSEIEKIAKMIKGADKYYLQGFSNNKTLDISFEREKSFKEEELAEMKKLALKYVKNCQIRG